MKGSGGDSGRVRIIGGRWRGRKLAVASRPSLRPSPDRVRETLFNWLSPYLSGAACLDLFAGTGVLGFEALSRDAAGVTFLDNDRVVTGLLESHCSELATTEAVIVEADVLTWLRTTPPTPYDIVFVDPPFGRGLIEEVAVALSRGWLKPHARVYLEAEKIPILDLEQSGWRLLREGQTRHVEFALMEIAPRGSD